MEIFNPKISICIPSYEADGHGVKFIEKNIQSILSQSYKNIEIIVSDHSKNDEIKNYVNNLNINNIKYFKYTENIGRPAFNTNNAIINSTGDYVKLMNLDDYIEGTDSLELMVNLLSIGYNWVISGCIHLNHDTGEMSNPIIPRIEGDGNHLINGLNYVGCPSVGLIPKNEFFDTNVEYMIDCELWYRMFLKYGHPGILQECRIIVSIGNHTLTNQLVSRQNELINKDAKYCNQKFLK